MGMQAEALKDYQKALQIDPNFETAQNNLNLLRTKIQ
jgi:hypothetical protein